MMKKYIFLLFLVPFWAISQPISLSNTTLDFQSVYYPYTDSIKLTLVNTSGLDIGVEGFSFTNIYGYSPFYVKDSVFVIPWGNQHEVWVYFSPEQNIVHDLACVIHTDYRGDYVVHLNGNGRFLNTYYNGTFNKNEEDLKSAMKTVLNAGAVDLGYNGARDQMFMTIDNQKVNGQGASQNTLECVYTGQQVVGYTTRTDAQNMGFNTEHTFPQGFFNSNVPMRSDLHHLFPTTETANSQRGNYPFGVVTGTPSWSVGGSKYANGIFEPRDAHKGEVARALFYFVVRFQDYSNHVQGQESILRTWNAEFPPTAVDVQRNEDIFAVQKNRNPFVDYPQFLKRITKISGNSVASAQPDIYISRDTVDMRFETQDLVYSVSVLNTGNQPVSLSNFAILNTLHFHFENTLNDTVLQPGQALEVEIAVNPQSNTTVTEKLTFTTDISGMTTQEVVLLGEWQTVSVPEISETSHPKIYPNPTENSVVVGWENKSDFHVFVYDQVGKLVMESQMNSMQTLDVRVLTPGIYHIHGIAENAQFHQILVRK